MDEEEALQNYTKIANLYLADVCCPKRKSEISEHNSKLDIEFQMIKVNGRNLTNIGLFRKYTEELS